MAIGIGVVFIQGTLKIYAGDKTPRTKSMTILDYYMVASVLLVLGQLIAQIGISFAAN